MKFKQTGRRVLTSPLIDSIVLIEGEMFDDGLFRLIAPEGAPPNVLTALEDTVRTWSFTQTRSADDHH